MRYFTADRIHNGRLFESEPKVLEFADDGTFIATHPAAVIPPEKVQYIPGTLTPGMVNAHCHLELSHMKGLIPEGGGLVSFLGDVVGFRNSRDAQRQELIVANMQQLAASGCIAVGDIANGTDTLSFRPQLPMHIHTFVEAMGFVPAGAESRMRYAEQVWQQFEVHSEHNLGFKLQQSIVPHAPYSVAPDLFARINAHQPGSVLSIHNQECAAENEYFQSKTGAMEQLYSRLGIRADWFMPQRQNSLPAYLPLIDNDHHLILVHNTFTQASDIELLLQQHPNASFCLCPNANLYIERCLPPVPTLVQSGINICLGTDSLASNHQLSVYAEVQVLLHHFDELSEEQVLSWACMGGAKALQLDALIGSFEHGKRPGLVQLYEGKSRAIPLG